MLEGLVSLPTDVLAARPSMQVLRDTMRIASTDTDVDGRRATLRAYAESCARLIDEHVETRSLNELLVVATGYLIELRLLGHFEESNAFGDRVNVAGDGDGEDGAGGQGSIGVVPPAQGRHLDSAR